MSAAMQELTLRPLILKEIAIGRPVTCLLSEMHRPLDERAEHGTFLVQELQGNQVRMLHL